MPRHILIGLASFFVLCAITVGVMRGGVNSPDEAANRLFIETWRASGSLQYAVSVAQPATYPLFPRSMMPIGNSVAPSGFVGLIVLFGSIARVIGLWAVPYLTIIFTLSASVAWWYLMRKIFNEQIANCAFWLFLFHPAVVYYTVRGLFPNMLLIDLIIMSLAGAWFVIEGIHSRSRAQLWAMSVLTIFAMLGAIATRPPEALVTYAMCAISLAIFGTRTLRRVAGAALAALVYVAGMLWLIRSWHIVPGGYSFLNSDSLWGILFPFGIHVSLIFHAGVRFIVGLFSPWVLVSTAGVLWWLWRAYKERTYDRSVAAYLAVIFPVSLWLFAVYGSWQISDNPGDPYAVTMGASYVRYWLPHLIFRMPFAAYVLYEIARYYPRFKPFAFKGCVTVAVILGIVRAYVGVDGLAQVVGSVREARLVVQQVSARVPADAVLAVRTWDKNFFPQFAVLQPFPREIKTYGAALELIGRGVPVWAFIEELKDTDILWLHQNGIDMRAVQKYNQHTLYELGVWIKK